VSARRRLVVASVIAIVGVLLGVGLFRPSGKSSSSGGTGAQPGQLAPLFQSTDLNGRPVSLSDYRGRPVLMNFWASWCVPCRGEFPVLKRLLASHPNLVLLGVVFQDGDGGARAFMQAQAATWPAVRDPSGQIAAAYDVLPKPGIPVSILITPAGHIIARQLGPLASDADAGAFVNQAG
jgi:cytochrome c biogenesis protein CcmG/thiol:disulfide interchange protein DsbE